MNFSAWFSRVTHRKPVDPSDGCYGVQPLLSLYSDKMTAPAESARVEAHLATCEDCRRALAWMQATNAVLAHREPVAPPADMTRRIRMAIAELETGKQARPARTLLAYRPAFAAAFTILIGAVIIAQITLHHSDVAPIKAPATHVAVLPNNAGPTVMPPTAVKPNVTPIAPVRRHANTQVATKLPTDTTHESSVGNGERSSEDSAAAREAVSKAAVLEKLGGLPEAPLHDAHVQKPVRPNSDIHLAVNVPHSAVHSVTPAVKHADSTQMAKHDVPKHENSETPFDTIPEGATPVAPTAPVVTQVAASDSHPIDALSGVRSTVNTMRLASYGTSPSARPILETGRVRNVGSSDPTGGSESGAIPIVYDPGRQH